ncbi:alcohol dehydrogenase catalytic domain-containing protein [Paeniglutamicibacter sp. Y32M11]|uniref:alcohol dehydrogenase catalytic domain-containing protein n=1 Tax=Paeniglutamicibacter sp. Y32M11 TaxID=2853258 RepID=UPI001C52B2B5|nr:alcohol dehydrogenase catalytic domain-containing protein [Paeniglutamicibacter sp. Y32M11]QXQ11817.1 alcohol dehydrogenase catalytic domain-containing protein [Paeniglutamicibacter sp. Y32M11]
MRAAILRELPGPGTGSFAHSRPLVIEEMPTPAPRTGEVGVDISYSSLCHSDLSVINGSRPRPLPMALGHEAVGRITALGEGVEHLKIGDKVVLVFVPGCGECRACQAGRPALCHRAAVSNTAGDLLHGPALLRGAGGERINHHLGVSAFADHAVVAAESVVPIDEDVPDEVAAMFGCAVLTGIGAIRHTAGLAAGQSVIVYGLGAVGLAAIMGAVLVGAGIIIAIDPNTAKHELALAAGATAVGTPEQARELVAVATGDGVDVAIEASGSARVIAEALEMLTRGGAVICVGLPHPEAELTVPALTFAGAGKRLLGSYMGDAQPAADIAFFIDAWRAGKLPVHLLHSDTRPLEDINQALDALAEGHVIRRLLKP